jgi:flagellar motor switch protein FliM
MPDDVLSQAEVENLLRAAEGKGKAAGPAVVRPAGAAIKQRDRIATYDFKRPERVGKEQMRALQTLHEGFGRNFGASLSALLRKLVEVKLTNVDQLTFGEFVFGLDNPTCFNLLKAEPLEGTLILEINPSILYPIIDRLLGGGTEKSLIARRPLTEIELGLVSYITDLFLQQLKRAWENVVALDLAVMRVESNPQLVQIVPPNEVVVLIGFEVVLGEARGMMNLCIPYNAIERLGSKLTANSWVSYGRRQPTEETVQQIKENLRGSLVQLSVDLAETHIQTKDMIELRVGDLITTEKDVHSPLVVRVQGVPKFYARPGTLKGRKAMEVQGEIKRTVPD